MCLVFLFAQRKMILYPHKIGYNKYTNMKKGGFFMNFYFSDFISERDWNRFSFSLKMSLEPTFKKRVQESKLCFLFEENEEQEIIGLFVGESLGNWLYIHKIWIDENIRGKGYGKKLMQKVETQALEQGIDYLFAEAIENEIAPFYRKNKFIKKFIFSNYLDLGEKSCFFKKIKA